MSRPVRYRPALDDGSREPWMKESELGGYVEYRDYAELKAEVERLQKAGEAMFFVGDKMREMIGDHHWTLMFDRTKTGWHYAAKGVQS